jgi:hypothetical protein
MISAIKFHNRLVHVIPNDIQRSGYWREGLRL